MWQAASRIAASRRRRSRSARCRGARGRTAAARPMPCRSSAPAQRLCSSGDAAGSARRSSSAHPGLERGSCRRRTPRRSPRRHPAGTPPYRRRSAPRITRAAGERRFSRARSVSEQTTFSATRSHHRRSTSAIRRDWKFAGMRAPHRRAQPRHAAQAVRIRCRGARTPRGDSGTRADSAPGRGCRRGRDRTCSFSRARPGAGERRSDSYRYVV